jgi:hypothetical protein
VWLDKRESKTVEVAQNFTYNPDRDAQQDEDGGQGKLYIVMTEPAEPTRKKKRVEIPKYSDSADSN